MTPLQTYYIGFYRYLDTKTWQRTNVNQDHQYLVEFLSNVQYIDKDSIIIKEIQLPE
jgi:hypothetical protein